MTKACGLPIAAPTMATNSTPLPSASPLCNKAREVVAKEADELDIAQLEGAIESHVLIIHEVEDYEKWKAIFEDAAEIRREAGEIAYQLLASDTDARRIVHFSRWTSLEAARAFFESPRLIEIRRIAGVHAPEFLYLNAIEARTL